MEINVVSGDITKHDAGAIIVNLFEGVTAPEGGTGAVDAALDGAITNLIESGDITGKSGEHVLVYSLGRLPSPRVIVSGLGKQDDFDAETVRKVTAEASRRARDAGATHAATIAHGAGIAGMAARESGQAIAEGGALGTWTFTEHKSPDDDRKELESLTIVEFDGSKVDDLQAGAHGRPRDCGGSQPVQDHGVPAPQCDEPIGHGGVGGGNLARHRNDARSSGARRVP